MDISYDEVMNLNVGLIGHVDSGKTTLAKALSTVASTASFDKHPQSQERGITIDLGFSSFLMEIPLHLTKDLYMQSKKFLQFTLVDCPGHASLLKTIISGSKIMHFAMCIIDITHGIQTQTAECIMLADILKIKLVFVLTKLDLLPNNVDIDEKVKKMCHRIKKTLEKTNYHDCPIIPVDYSGKNSFYSLKNLKDTLVNCVHPIGHNIPDPKKFLFAVDHCFNIKGHGTVVTGTVIDGCVTTKSNILVATTNDLRKVKSIQVFHKNVSKISQGDRAGICITQFDSSAMERGLLCSPGVVSTIQSFICVLNYFQYYKHPISNKTKYHISVSFDTVVGVIQLFKENDCEAKLENFNMDNSFISLPQLECGNCYAFITLQNPILYCHMDTIIGLKLDQDISKKSCRIAFHGTIIKTFANIENSSSKYNDIIMGLPPVNIYHLKTKIGHIDRIYKENCIIVKDMFKKESKIDHFIGFPVYLSNGHTGIIDSTFGNSGKIKIILDNLSSLQLNLINNPDTLNSSKSQPIAVVLKYRQLIGDKSKIFKCL